MGRVFPLLRKPAMLSLLGRGMQFLSQLAMVLVIPKALAPEAYVQLNLVLPLAFLATAFAFGWLRSSVQRHVYELLDPEKSAIRQTVFAYYLLASLALFGLYASLTFLTDSIYRLVPLLLVATAFKTTVVGVLNASHNHKGFFLANLGFAASLGVFIGLCFAGTAQDLELFLSIYALLDTAIASVAWMSIGLVVFRPLPRMHRSVAGRYLRYGLPLVANVLARWVISLSDRYLLNLWEPTDIVAGYILSYQLAGSVIMIPLSFFIVVFFPRVLKIDREEGESAALAYTYRMLGYYLRYSALFFVVACAFVLPLKYYGYPAYEFNPAVVCVIVLAHVIFGSATFYNKEFELNGRTFTITKAVSLGAAVNVALNLVLIPPFSAMGAAVATLAGYSAVVFVVYRSRAYSPNAE